jgi:hypothetical protein
MMCGKPKSERALKPVESILPCPSLTEPSEERMMDMQDDLFFLGQWPGMDEDDGDEDEEYLVNSGPYKILARDVFEDLRRAFNSRLWYRDRDYVSQCFWCGTSERGTLAPGQDHRYLGEMKAPAVWYYRQTKLTEFFKYVEYKIYLQAVTAS